MKQEIIKQIILAERDREISELKKENSVLKSQVESIKEQYAQDMSANFEQTQRLLNDIENLRAEINQHANSIVK